MIKPSLWRNWVGPHRLGVLAGVLLFFGGLYFLGVRPGNLIPNEGGLKLAGDFFEAAFKPPAVTYESEVPEGIEPFLWKTAKALWLTFRYAVVAMSLALVIGLVFGFLGARSWWPEGAGGGVRRLLGVMRWCARVFSAVIRSVHELLWALLFLTALGTSPLAAVVAIALPYGGTLAKVFSEMLDEQNESSMEAIRASGAGLLPHGWSGW